MKKLLLMLCLLMVTGTVSAQRYIFFLHNMYLELYGTEGVHPEYGKAEYGAIISEFKKAGFIVISELRPKNTDAMQYARKVQHQVDSLLKKGVATKNITIVGTSKGGYIAMYASALLKNTDINYVLVACCGDGAANDERVQLYGNILSIYESSDTIAGSCDALNAKAGNNVLLYKEIQLHTGLKHGFLYKPLKEWVQPTIQWANQVY